MEISFEQIAEKFIKYYWNQTIYFDLVQGSNHKKIPEVMSATKSLIESYQKARNSKQPVRYEKAESQFEKLCLMGEYNKLVKKISKTLKHDVSWRL